MTFSRFNFYEWVDVIPKLGVGHKFKNHNKIFNISLNDVGVKVFNPMFDLIEHSSAFPNQSIIWVKEKTIKEFLKRFKTKQINKKK